VQRAALESNRASMATDADWPLVFAFTRLAEPVEASVIVCTPAEA
jgi:hypothetical protein